MVLRPGTFFHCHVSEFRLQLMKEKKDEGKAILFISHDIEEIMDKCDSLTVLRDGLFIANLQKEEFNAD